MCDAHSEPSSSDAANEWSSSRPAVKPSVIGAANVVSPKVAAARR